MIIPITLIANKLKSLSLLLFFIPSLLIYAQEKETLYISFKEDSLNKFYKGSKYVSFKMSPSFFTHRISDGLGHYPEKHKKRKVKLYEIKEKLITKEEANKKVNEYLEKSAKQRQKDALAKGFSNKDAEIIYNVNHYPPVYAFNSYFKKIYIYHVQDEMLYEVNWEYSIDCL